MRRTRRTILCVILALTCGATAGWRLLRPRMETAPVRVPLSLERGGTTRASFVAQNDVRYDLSVEYRRNLPFEALDRMLPLDLDVSVTEGGTPIHRSRSGGFWSRDVFGNRYAGFRGRRGHRYDVVARLKHGARERAILQPRLMVTVFPSDVRPAALAVIAESAITVALFITGLILLVAPFARTQTRAEPFR